MGLDCAEEEPVENNQIEYVKHRRVMPENANAVKKGTYLVSARNVTRPMLGITRTGMNNKAGHGSLHEIIKSLFRMQLSEACLSPAVSSPTILVRLFANKKGGLRGRSFHNVHFSLPIDYLFA
jgi:hypothetical protein